MSLFEHKPPSRLIFLNRRLAAGKLLLAALLTVGALIAPAAASGATASAPSSAKAPLASTALLSATRALTSAQATTLGSGSGFCASYGGLSTSQVSIDSVYPCAYFNIYHNTSDQFGIQCVEFSNRFEAVAYGEPSVSGPGWNVVNELHSQDRVPIQAMGPGHLPQPGDVISMWGPGQDYLGHTGVVYSVNVNTSNGNGTITYYDENGSLSSGLTIGSENTSNHNAINVSNWQMATPWSSPYHYTQFNWTQQNTHTSVALIPNDGASGYSVDGFGNLHAFGNAPTNITYNPKNAPPWGWDIARGIAVAHNSTRWAATGYVLDGYGGIHPFAAGTAEPPEIPSGAYWPGWDIARGIVLSGNRSGYVLDGYGRIHPFAAPGVTMPTTPSITDSWPGWDIARGIVLDSAVSGYVLDGYGRLHPFAVPGFPMPPVAQTTGSWDGWDIARAVVLSTVSPDKGYVLTGHGSIYRFTTGGATMPSVTSSNCGYWSDWDIVRAIAVDPVSGAGVMITGTGAPPCNWQTTTT